MVVSHPESIKKKLFIERLTVFLCADYPLSSIKHGFIPDIYRLLKKYDLQQYMDGYLSDGAFPSKPWKRIICESVAKHQWLVWRDRLSERSELDLFQ